MTAIELSSDNFKLVIPNSSLETIFVGIKEVQKIKYHSNWENLCEGLGTIAGLALGTRGMLAKDRELGIGIGSKELEKRLSNEPTERRAETVAFKFLFDLIESVKRGNTTDSSEETTQRENNVSESKDEEPVPPTAKVEETEEERLERLAKEALEDKSVVVTPSLPEEPKLFAPVFNEDEEVPQARSTTPVSAVPANPFGNILGQLFAGIQQMQQTPVAEPKRESTPKSRRGKRN